MGAARLGRLSERPPVWLSMLGLVGLEFALGVVAFLVVPTGRPSGLVPHRGTLIYLVHTIVGALLGIGAVVLMVAANHAGRPVRIGAIVGLVGVMIGAGGGVLTVDHALRLLGMALMVVGTAGALLGYLMPVVSLTEIL
jgi:hypothetical protein